MPRGLRGAEEIVNTLRQSVVGLARGSSVAEVCELSAITHATHVRRRKECGGVKADRAKRLQALEQENARLKRLPADADRGRENFRAPRDARLASKMCGERSPR
jgi:hypothetical protein